MHHKSIPIFVAIACAMVGSPDILNGQVKDSPKYATGWFVATAGGERDLLKRIDAATRKVKSASYVAQMSVDGGTTNRTFTVTLKRDPSALQPVGGKVLLGFPNQTDAIAFDGRIFRVRRFDPQNPLSETEVKDFFLLYQDMWITFLHPTPFQAEVDSTAARLEGVVDVGGRRCSVVYVESKNRQRARWYFDQGDGFPRRVERLPKEGSDEPYSIATLTNLRINEPVDDRAFNIGRRVARFSAVAARHLAKIYCLSMPIFGGDIESFLAEHRYYFSETGESIRLAKALGATLIKTGMQSYRGSDGPSWADRAQRIANAGGVPPEFAASAATELNRSERNRELELFAMGIELLWLSDVLPLAAKGNWEKYNAQGTFTRRQLLELEPLVEQMSRTTPEVAQILEVLKMQSGPLAEEYMVALLRTYDQALQ